MGWALVLSLVHVDEAHPFAVVVLKDHRIEFNQWTKIDRSENINFPSGIWRIANNIKNILGRVHFTAKGLQSIHFRFSQFVNFIFYQQFLHLNCFGILSNGTLRADISLILELKNFFERIGNSPHAIEKVDVFVFVNFLTRDWPQSCESSTPRKHRDGFHHHVPRERTRSHPIIKLCVEFAEIRNKHFILNVSFFINVHVYKRQIQKNLIKSRLQNLH
mgnify:FL=1